MGVTFILETLGSRRKAGLQRWFCFQIVTELNAFISFSWCLKVSKGTIIDYMFLRDSYY